jgi:hypothetical protein
VKIEHELIIAATFTKVSDRAFVSFETFVGQAFQAILPESVSLASSSPGSPLDRELLRMVTLFSYLLRKKV